MTLNRARVTALLGVVFLGILPSACVSPIDGTIGLPPLFETDLPPPDGAPAETRWTLRPLVSHDRREDLTEVGALWPLFLYRREPTQAKDWFLPIYFHRQWQIDAEGRSDWDTVFFPFFYYGNSPKEGPYFLFFPFGGVSKGLLGQARMDWALFPLFVRVVRGERSSKHVLWPLINWMKGPHHGGGRFFPFFGRYTAKTEHGEDKYDRRFFLWPFFHYHRNNLDTDRPVTSFWFFPFFGKIQSENVTRYSLLWPLFTVVRKRDTRTMALPIVPVIFTRGPDREQTDLWPLFGHKRLATPTGVTERQYFLWPIQRYQYSRIENNIHESFWFIPIFWHHRKRDLKAETDSSITRVWPLVTVRKDANGEKTVHVVDLFPFHRRPKFDRFYSRIWRFYRYRALADDRGSDWEFLWGLVRGKKRPEDRSFSLLGGLFGREVSPSDTRWRILYIPF